MISMQPANSGSFFASQAAPADSTEATAAPPRYSANEGEPTSERAGSAVRTAAAGCGAAPPLPELPRLCKRRVPYLPPAPIAQQPPAPYAAAYRRRLARRLAAQGLPAFLLVRPEIRDRRGRAEAYRRLRAVMVTWEERRLVKLTSQAAGTFGKFSPALFEGEAEMVATKTMRLFPRRRGGGTEATDFAQAVRERDILRRFYSPAVTLLHDPRANKLMLIMPLAMATLNANSSRPEVLQRFFVRSSIRQLAAQLAQMHTEGVVHCDLKPANIFLHRDGRIRAADMGKASPVQRPIVGTPSYAAPELLRRSPGELDGRVDIWSLAVALLDAITPIKGRLFSPREAFAIYGQHADFEAWRQEICAAAGACPARLAAGIRAAAHSSPLAAYFADVVAKDAEVCHFVLTRMLVPMAERARAPEVEAFAAGLQPAGSTAEQEARAALAFHAQGPRMRAIKVALEERLRDELMGAGMAAARSVVPDIIPTLRFQDELFGPLLPPPPGLADEFFRALEAEAPALHSLLISRVFVAAPDITMAQLVATTPTPLVGVS